MRHSGPRSSRARRRHSPRPQPAQKVETPQGWPSGELLTEALDINSLARDLLAEMKPEAMRTILQRMDVQARQAALEPRSIPAAKVSLRAASQVLAMLRAEDKPAESTLLGTLLAPAADLFHEAVIGPSQLVGLRLKLVDLALPLIVHSESVFKGIRTWHRWCDESFEDLTLTVVIGLQCSNAALAAAYLSASHPDIAQRYEGLREEHPAMPRIAEARLTPSNPLSRYLAARPDRKLPANTAELHTALTEDGRTRLKELEQAKQERRRAASERTRRQRQREDALTHHEAETPIPVEPVPEHRLTETEPQSPWEAMLRPELAALPEVVEWAAAVADSRRLTERLIAGEAPTLPELAAIVALRLRLDKLSRLLGEVLGQPVAATRSDIDRALTLVLSDPETSQRLGSVPRTVADLTARLAELPTTVAAVQIPADEAPVPEAVDVSPAPAPADPDLSDLDSILHGEAGAQLVALAGGGRDAASDNTPAHIPQARESDTGHSESTGTAPADPSLRDTQAHKESPQQCAARESTYSLLAIAMTARFPQGELAQAYSRLSPALDLAVLESDPQHRSLALCTALPMALTDPSCGAMELLGIAAPELAGCPRLLEFREMVAELGHQGVSLFDPSVHRIGLLMERFAKSGTRATEIQATAGTRTLKYDKATKVYRHWMAPGGLLRPLVDALADNRGLDEISELAEQCRKTGASRAIDDTVSDVFGAGKPRIVAGARKTLIDKFTEVLEVAEFTEHVAAEVRRERLSDRSSTWRFDQVIKFRERVHAALPGVEAELEQRFNDKSLPHPWIYPLASRAMSIAITPQPQYGPELSLDAARRWLDVDNSAESAS